MKPEQLLWALVRQYIPGHKERIENAAGVGMPDVHFTYKGFSCWMELKVAKYEGQPIEETLEPSQRVWHLKDVNEGGRVYVLLRDGVTLQLFKAMRNLDSNTICRYASVWKKDKPWNWFVFEGIMENI